MKFALCLLSLTVLFACRTTGEKSAVKDAASIYTEQIPPLKCDAGDPNFFFMKSLDDATSAKDFPIENPDKVSVIGGSELMGRLDICLDGDTPVLKRIVFGMADRGDVVNVVPNSKIEGLSDMLFNESYDNLEILVPFESYIDQFGDKHEKSDEFIWIKGSAAHKAALITVVKKNGEKITATKRFLNWGQIGRFEFGEIGGCKSDATGTFTLGTATFSWKGKHSTGTSGGAAPALCSVTIVDKAKQLGPRAGLESTLIFPYDGDENYKFRYNHHSVCDSIMFKTGDATYYMTASLAGFGGGTCPGVLQGAPVGGSGVNFKFVYGNSKPVEGSLNSCKHMTRDCSKAAGGGDGGFGINKK